MMQGKRVWAVLFAAVLMALALSFAAAEEDEVFTFGDYSYRVLQRRRISVHRARAVKERGLQFSPLHTPKGMDYLQTTAARLAEAEKRAFDAWTDAEICAYVGMAERYVEAFRTEIQKIK